MNRSTLLLPVLLVIAGACTSTPTSSVEAGEVAPPFINGPSYEIGNQADEGDRLTIDATTTSVETTESDSTGRNGYTYGSGN